MRVFCDNCKKKYATFHLSQEVGGKYSEIDLCLDCLFKIFSSGEIFSFTGEGLFDPEDPEDHSGIEILCDFCGVPYSEYKKDKRSGCPRCVISFCQYIEPLPEGEDREPETSGDFEKREQWSVRAACKKELEKAINDENYEYAAILRDRIKELDSLKK